MDRQPSTLAIIKPGVPVPEGWHESYRKELTTVDDIDQLVTRQAMLDGLVHAFKKVGADASEVGKGMAWTELRIGELLGEPPGKGPGRGNKTSSANDVLKPNQIMQFRKMAWPSKHRKAVAAAIMDGQWRRNERLRVLEQFINEEKVSGAKSIDELDGVFSTIVVDPPWDWRDEGDVDQMGRGKPTYHTMTINELMAFPLGDKAAKDSHLYCWVTNRSMRKVFDLVDSWGFRFVTILTWNKPSFGMGNYFRGQTEHIVFAVRGQLPLRKKDVGTSFNWPRRKGGRHSAKPSQFYDLTESCSPGPYLDIFSRYQHNDEWTTWGENGSSIFAVPQPRNDDALGE